MSGRPLQQTGYQASHYERPNERWSCGQLGGGDPCPFGPSSGGQCGWVCTPRETASGGLECGRPGNHQCDGEPTRDAKGRAKCCQVGCQPAPSIRRQRGLLSVGAVLLTLAALGLSLSYEPARDAVVSPGGLSSHHAALACSECHTAAVASETQSWTVAALRREHVTEKVDSAKCARCHKLQAPDWRFAHTLAASSEDPGLVTLAALQSRSEAHWAGSSERPQAGPVLQGAAWLAQQYGQLDADGRYDVAHQLDCLLCHGEHRGTEASLHKDVAEHRCTVCHTVKFESFVDGHPAFENFGKRRLPGNVIFTHGTHYENYGMAPKDAEGHVDLSRGAACSSCHETDDRGRHMVLKPRTYEQECLRCHQATAEPIVLLQAPSGPELAWTGDMDKRPYLPRLGEVPEAPTLFRVLLGETDFRELRGDQSELRSIHNSLLELAPVDEDGDEAFSEGDLTGPPELKPLRKWLSSLEDREDLSEDDQARLEEAQDLIKSLERSRKNLSRTLKKGRRKSVKRSVKRLQAYGKRIAGLVEQLAGGDYAAVREAFGLSAEADLSGLELVFPREQLGAFGKAWFDERGTAATRNLSLQPKPDALQAWQGGGRLVANDAIGGLRYEGYTHLDPFLRAVLDLAKRAPRPVQQEVFSVLAERCAKCHALGPQEATDEAAGQDLLVRWRAVIDPPEAARRLTHFAHDAHLGMASCQECHQMQTRELSERAASDFQTAERWGQIGAAGVSQSGCRECHTPQAYGAGCQLCHDYHAGALTPGAGTMPAASLSERAGAPAHK